MKDNEKEFKKVCSFLGINKLFSPVYSKINERHVIEMSYSVKILSFLSQLTYNARKRIGLANLNLLNNVWLKHKRGYPKQVLTTELLDEMRAFFQSDLEKTSQLLNRDLTYWIK